MKALGTARVYGERVIAVVVLTFRAEPGVLRRCLDSVVRSGDADRVVVVDNGPSVGIDDLPAGVDLVTPGDNLGYAGGMNVGLRHALAGGADAVALLNDDTVVSPGWLAALALHLDDTRRTGAVQPKLLLAGDPPRVQSVGVRLRGDWAGIDIGYGEADTGQYDRVGEIAIFSGGAVLLSRAFLDDVGGFDERYFLYYEDIDLALRGAERGWRYCVEPAAVVHHDMSATTSADPHGRRYWQERNRLWCAARHGSPVGIARALALAVARLAKHPGRPQATAIRDGLKGLPARLAERRHPLAFPLS
jgi:GT2 family glycosyltransferase